MAEHAPNLRTRVYGFLLDRGNDGATDEEGARALGLKAQTYTPRRRELVQLNAVRDTGRRRKTESGRSAAVWEAVTTDLRDLAKRRGGG